MRKRKSLAALAVIAGLLASCSASVDKQPPTSGARAMFDPAIEAVPLPSDVLRNADTGLMALPINQDTDSDLTKEIKESINTLDGWLTTSTVTIPFDAPLDPATVNGSTVVMYDVTHARDANPSVTRISADDFYVLYNVGAAPATEAPYWITVKNKSAEAGQFPKPFEQGHKYAVVVLDGVKGADGLPIIQHGGIHMLMSQTPLVDINGHSTTILPAADMQLLEGARRTIYAPAAIAIEKDLGISRDRFASMAAFSVESGPRPAFDPTKLPALDDMPTPFGKDASADSIPEAQLDQPYAPKSVVPGQSCFFWMVDGGGLKPISFHVETAEKPNGKNRYPIRFIANEKLRPLTTYQLAITEGVTGSNGVPAQPEAFFSLMAATSPLLVGDKKDKLGSPFIDFSLDVLILFGTDPAKATANDWSFANTALNGTLSGLETLRVDYQAKFKMAEATGLKRSQVKVMWTFTTKEAQQ